MKKGKINEAFKALDIAFVESDIRNLWDWLNSQQERKHYFGEYSLKQYALDRIKGTEALYASLDKVIEELVAKKEIALAQSISDRLMSTPTTQVEGDYRLWNQEKMDTLLGRVKEHAA